MDLLPTQKNPAEDDLLLDTLFHKCHRITAAKFLDSLFRYFGDPHILITEQSHYGEQDLDI